jgi:nucleotide-binding universal stress UspA family protein
MLKSILVHLDAIPDSSAVIHHGVSLARHAQAKVFGLSLMDTRRLVDFCAGCESAGHLVFEQENQKRKEQFQFANRAALTTACLHAGLNFDVHRLEGDPLEILPNLACNHDLVVTTLACKSSLAGWTTREVIRLLARGVSPILVLRPGQETIQRVLLVFDGTEATGGAIRTFLSLGLFPDAEVRLLGIGSAANAISMRKMVDCCRMHLASIETGCLRGTPRRHLAPYTWKWQSDLVVFGVERRPAAMSCLFGRSAFHLLQKASGSLFFAG